MAAHSRMLPLGTPAPNFRLPSIKGQVKNLTDFDDAPALLVMFICEHCPFVRHIESELGAVVARYQPQGLAAVGIMSNDLDQNPSDDEYGMEEQAERAGFTFDYLWDERQFVALAYGAACTPDFFLFDGERKLVYRGQFDDSRPKNDIPVTGEDLAAAIEAVLSGDEVSPDQTPSLGCGISWVPGNEPPIS